MSGFVASLIAPLSRPAFPRVPHSLPIVLLMTGSSLISSHSIFMCGDLLSWISYGLNSLSMYYVDDSTSYQASPHRLRYACRWISAFSPWTTPIFTSPAKIRAWWPFMLAIALYGWSWGVLRWRGGSDTVPCLRNELCYVHIFFHPLQSFLQTHTGASISVVMISWAT